jgi:release factor glutamine methyltransferase
LTSAKSDTPTISSLLSRSTGYLREKGSTSPRLDAELLLAEVLGLTRVELYTNFEQPLNNDEVDAYRELVRRRGRGEPVAYIVGRAYFRNLTLRVSPAVLVPRPETEHVVDSALTFLMEGDWGPHSPEVLDLGTGSGAIAVSLAAGFPEARITATDASSEALEIAAENARIEGAAGRVVLMESDLFDRLDPLHTFDLIVCNPPYISAEEWPTLPVDVRDHEPRHALYGGRDGLDFYRRLAAEAPQFLRPQGCLIMEIGHNQGVAVTELLRESGLFDSVDIEKDYAGHDRVVTALRSRI